ncbi:MAG: NUDIX domain-containing protein [Rubrimonas sp.]
MLTTVATRVAFENRWVRLREDDIRYPDGSEGVYTFIERPRYAIAAAVQDGCIWLVEQWRHPIRARMWELPMGVAPGGDSIPIEQAARIELREETGLVAETMERVAEIAPAPALVAQTGVLFLAKGLTQGEQALEPTEQDLIARPWPVDEAVAAALDGRIRDGATVASLCVLRLKGLI